SDRSLRAHIVEVSMSPPTFVLVAGNDKVETEVEHAFEAGYRYNWKDKFSLDAAVYYNDFYGLIGRVPGAAIVHASPLYIELPSIFTNIGNSQTHGLEIYMKYAPIKRWTVSTGFTMLRGTSQPGLTNPGPVLNDPRQQVNVQSRIDLRPRVHFDASYY